MPSSQLKDHYQTLGVSRTATPKDLKTAFRKLARQFHPDANLSDPHAEDRFKEINEAYEVLNDEGDRKLYDRYGDDWRSYRDAGYTGSEPRNPPRGASYTTFSGGNGRRTQAGTGDEAFGSLFDNMFARPGAGSSTFRTRSTKGSDIEQRIDVSFDEAFRGTERRFEIQSPETCSLCSGEGLVRGAICPRCNGSGTTNKAKTIEVSIPPGVLSGQRIRVKGQGGIGRAGGTPGDVFLIVNVRSDPRFERDGANLKVNVDVPYLDAVLGGEVTVPTPTGRVALTVPSGTQNGRVFRLRNQGMPKVKNTAERGDLLATVNVQLPTDLSEEERELFDRLRSLEEVRN